jgi:hypothetical protein
MTTITKESVGKMWRVQILGHCEWNIKLYSCCDIPQTILEIYNTILHRINSTSEIYPKKPESRGSKPDVCHY